jgi:predicted MPP superfamily phosphohydrolase
MWLYTNRGIGVTGPPVRFNCRPEVTQITLTTTSHDI